MAKHPEPIGHERSLDDSRLKPRYTRSDIEALRMAAKAAKSGWHVPDQMRTDTLLQCAEVLEHGTHDQKLVAAKVLIAMDAHDQRERIEDARREETTKLAISLDAYHRIPDADDRFVDRDQHQAMASYPIEDTP